MYKVFNLENTSVALKDEFRNNHSWSVYPQRWNVEQIILGANESTQGKCLEYGTCACSIRNANALKSNPLKFVLYQPYQTKDDKLLSSARIMTRHENCIIDTDFKNNLLNDTEISEGHQILVDILNGDMNFVTNVANDEIKDAKKIFCENTGFTFDEFKDMYEYYHTIKEDVKDFIKKINPYVKKELGLTLSIKHDPLCTYGCGEWVTSGSGEYGREGKIRMEVEQFWLDIIRWNRTHPDKMRGIKYRKETYSKPTEYGELNIKKFFKK